MFVLGAVRINQRSSFAGNKLGKLLNNKEVVFKIDIQGAFFFSDPLRQSLNYVPTTLPRHIVILHLFIYYQTKNKKIYLVHKLTFSAKLNNLSLFDNIYGFRLRLENLILYIRT